MNTAAPEANRAHTADIVVAWLLYALQLGGQLFLSAFWLMSVMAGDSCGSVPNDLKVCDGSYFVTWFFGYASVLLLAAVATPVAIVVAGRRGARRWPWPVLAIALLAVASAVYLYALTR